MPSKRAVELENTIWYHIGFADANGPPALFTPAVQKIEPGYLERTSVLDFVGAASSRDRFNSRLEAAPTGVFFSYLSLPDKRKIENVNYA